MLVRLIALTVALCSAASAAPPVIVSLSDEPNTIRVEGFIEERVASEFEAAELLRPGVTTIELNSHGGEVGPAVALARYFHDRGFNTVIRDGSACYSACAYLFLAGIERKIEGDGVLAVHQMSDQTERDAAFLTARMRRYGVDARVIDLIINTPHNNLRVFTRDELVEFGIVTP